jgi:signal transduction histidine kinase
LEHTYRGLAFGVLDDGPGVDPTILGRGSGLRMLADRIAAAGGALELLSTPGKGTTVRGFIPI